NVHSRDWNTLESSNNQRITLTITKSGQLTLRLDKTILEYCNLMSSESFNIMSRNSTLLVVASSQNLPRKWRVQFNVNSGEEDCASCARFINMFRMSAQDQLLGTSSDETMPSNTHAHIPGPPNQQC
ncbi:unnamed protein product, partial [Meganyctiphanes norvegica]